MPARPTAYTYPYINGLGNKQFILAAPVSIIQLNNPNIQATVCHEIGHEQDLGDTYAIRAQPLGEPDP